MPKRWNMREMRETEDKGETGVVLSMQEVWEGGR